MLQRDFGHLPLSAIRTATLTSAVFSIAMILAVVVTLNHMILIRAFGQPIVWHLELAIYLTIGAFFLGMPYVILARGDVSIDLLSSVLAARNAEILHFLILLIILATCSYLFASGYLRALEAYSSNLRSTSLWGPPLWPVYASMPLGLGLTCLQLLAELACTLAKLQRGKAHE